MAISRLMQLDDGEAFGAPHENWGHGHALFDENVRVPLILWNPLLYGPGSSARRCW